MENSELIRNIIVSAQNSAAAIIANAKDDSEETKAGVKAELDIKRTAALAAAEKEAELLIARKLSVAALEKNKALLSARQKVLKSVYEQVMQKILNMSDNIYREFIGTLIKKYAENGDRVIVNERDSKRITADFIKKTAEEMRISLFLDSDFHLKRGGIILSGAKYDKNLTLETLIADLRENTETKVAKKVFGEN